MTKIIFKVYIAGRTEAGNGSEAEVIAEMGDHGYYRNYIEDENAKGESEDAVVNSLGDTVGSQRKNILIVSGDMEVPEGAVYMYLG
ncbi:MAG: hypothetical protein V8S08_07430 [Lachnoclostridium sp.]